jgi:exonuclease III
MKILCLNGWGGRLYAPLVAYLKSEAADVVCLQEVVHSPAARTDWLTYRDGDHILPQRANFFRDVAGILPDHTAIFCPAAEGTLWDDALAVPSQWGLATFVRHTLPITAQAQGFVHKTFSPHGFGEHPRSRTAHVIRVYDFQGERSVCIAQMHGLRDPNGKGDTSERRQQAERLAELCTRVAAPGDALIVCGDFNVEPQSQTFAILGRLGLTDLVTAGGDAGTRTSHYHKPGRFADYMLVNRQVEVRAFSIVRTPEVSDHCPLVLTI